MEVDAKTAQVKRYRSSQKSASSASPGDKDKAMDDLTNIFKKTRLDEATAKAKSKSASPKAIAKSKSASPKATAMTGVEEARASANAKASASAIAKANEAVLDAARASKQFQNAKEELDLQIVEFAQISTIITNFERTVDGFLETMKKDHKLGLYAYSVMEQNISSMLSGDIRMLRDMMKRMSAFPGQLADQVRDFPKKVEEGIKGVQYFSKPEEYIKLRENEKEQRFSQYAQGTANYSPGGLLIKAIGFPTILGKTDTKSKREVLTKIHSFKRMFPAYTFTRLELDFIRQWLTTGKTLFGFNYTYKQLTPEEQQKDYWSLLMALFGKDAVRYFGEEKASSP